MADAGSPPPQLTLETLRLPDRDNGLAGHVVYTVADFASDEECEALCSAADALLDSHGVDMTSPAAMAAMPPRTRLPIATKMDAVLLERVLSLMEDQLPEVATTLFGQDTGLAQMVRRFSDGEPAINIYKSGGEFAPHTDKEALSLLIPLSDAGSFEGGGTAYWSDSHYTTSADISDANAMADRNLWIPHHTHVNPPKGTAVIFKGDVTHAGLAVTAGVRKLFVMSFSLRARAAKKADAGDAEESGTDDEMAMVRSDGEDDYDSDLGF